MFSLHKNIWLCWQFVDGYEYNSNSLKNYNTEHLSKLNNLHITRSGLVPLSIRIPASHYIRYVCPQCIIHVQSFLDLLSAVLTSDQPAFQSAIIWKLFHMIIRLVIPVVFIINYNWVNLLSNTSMWRGDVHYIIT